MCSSPNVSCMLMCQHDLRTCACMPMCLAFLRACVPMCLECLCAHEPTYLPCLYAPVPTCLECLPAHMPCVLTSSHALSAYVLMCQCALHAHVAMCLDRALSKHLCWPPFFMKDWDLWTQFITQCASERWPLQLWFKEVL